MSLDDKKILSIVGHLTELRRRLIIIVIAVLIGMGISWGLANSILVYIEKPLTSVTYIDATKLKVYRYLQQNYPAIYRMGDMEKELNQPKKQHALNYTKPLEPFFVQCKISAIAGFVLALPVVFHQIWAFVAPGLTRKERRLVVPFMMIGTIAFCIGAFFFLTTVWPFIINFSLSYESEGLRSWLSLSAYVDFCLRLILMFGLMAELPVITLLLSRFGLVSYKFMASKRKYALLASSIVAAFHSDLVTMFVIMIPMYMMYEVSVWVARIFGRKRQPATP
ncbi:MAG: twin-arginine translocase subunit TatC [Trichlorobacter sp.]|jgi:sec-independent protein translocase protein TatC|nr:twin-arginine translocase subunit TatC [Trichlorobacter sp.]